MALFRAHANREERKPDFDVGDHVKVNMHSLGYRGTEGIVSKLWRQDNKWYVNVEGHNFTLYAYKFDIVSRAAESNNEIAWERHMIAGDPFEPEKPKKPENHWGLPF